MLPSIFLYAISIILFLSSCSSIFLFCLQIRAERKRKEDLQKEIDRYDLLSHELQNHADALIIACLELAEVTDEETDEPAFAGDWRAVRSALLDMVEQHKERRAPKMHGIFEGK